MANGPLTLHLYLFLGLSSGRNIQNAVEEGSEESGEDYSQMTQSLPFM